MFQFFDKFYKSVFNSQQKTNLKVSKLWAVLSEPFLPCLVGINAKVASWRGPRPGRRQDITLLSNYANKRPQWKFILKLWKVFYHFIKLSNRDIFHFELCKVSQSVRLRMSNVGIYLSNLILLCFVFDQGKIVTLNGQR